ncbi:hypothetical protein SY83_02720 [Paenibacillus swuensis]|uniref:O-antigen ligase-related domain-containing protein n=1 Tax=Paenibacillus swuensis TaxID=1178515 RepID=A0A172TEQ5_9BACL|nr:O-antigen ligase family protein [Paenibacillus swuensis]ANE45416.1 hypothetical protein SY83_02720 [Paenibacillus swuensis]
MKLAGSGALSSSRIISVKWLYIAGPFLGLLSVNLVTSVLWLAGVLLLLSLFYRETFTGVTLLLIPFFSIFKIYYSVGLSLNELMVIYAFIMLLWFEQDKQTSTSGNTFIIMLFVFSTSSLIFNANVDPSVMVKEWIKSIVYFMTFYIGLFYVTHEARLRKVILLLLVSAIVTAYNGVLQYVVGTSIAALQPWGPSFEYTIGKIRVYSTFDNPIYFGAYLIIMIGIAIGMLFYNPDRKLKWTLCLFLIGALPSLVFTYSRGAWIGLGISFITLIFFGTKPRVKWMGIGIVVLLAVAFPLLPDIFQNRLQQTTDFGDRSVIQRFYVYDTALQMIKENLFFGVGPGRFKYEYPAYMKSYASQDATTFTAENTFLELFVENGLIFFLTYISIWILFFYNTYYVFTRTASSLVKGYSFGSAIGMLGFLIDNMFAQMSSTPIVLTYWLLFGISYANKIRLDRDTALRPAKDRGYYGH